MAKKNPAETWFRVTTIRERRSQQSFARAQADMSRAQERLREMEALRDAELAEAREQVGGTISAASLGMMSQALQVGRKRVTEASDSADALAAPLAAAQETLQMSAQQRMIAEKWVQRRRARERAARLKKLQRSEDDLTSARAQAGPA